MLFKDLTLKLSSLACLLLLFSVVSASAVNTKQHIVNQPADTNSLQSQLQDFTPGRKMTSTAFPIEMKVTGSVVRINSKHNQILPIYTRSGAFYMAMRINKGTNWLNGLPKGRYYINNRPITIN